MDIIPKTFEDCYAEVESIVERLRSHWTFRANAMRDFEDIKIEIITHIWQKWDKYDQLRPLGGWVATVAKNRFWNLLRDIYLSTSSPCSKCACNEGQSADGEGMCSIYGRQGVECPIYKKWDKTKKYAHQARLPVTLDDKEFHLAGIEGANIDMVKASNALHDKMKEVLSKSEWEIYHRIFVLFQDENQVAEELGFKKNEEKRKTMGDRRVRQVKTLAVKKAKEILKKYGIEGL